VSKINQSDGLSVQAAARVLATHDPRIRVTVSVGAAGVEGRATPPGHPDHRRRGTDADAVWRSNGGRLFQS
jgi:hypothetical protein